VGCAVFDDQVFVVVIWFNLFSIFFGGFVEDGCSSISSVLSVKAWRVRKPSPYFYIL
jgi:hypothetical protein